MNTLEQMKQELAELGEEDNQAFTVKELAEARGIKLRRMREICVIKVDNGSWERVYKMVGNMKVPAYRNKASSNA